MSGIVVVVVVASSLPICSIKKTHMSWRKKEVPPHRRIEENYGGMTYTPTFLTDSFFYYGSERRSHRGGEILLVRPEENAYILLHFGGVLSQACK